jgi:hypothetical protein
MDAVSNGDEGLPASTMKGDENCICWSPQRTEEICMCNYAEGHAAHDISTGVIRSPGSHLHNKLSRRVLIQHLKELLLRSDVILQNSARLQMLSQNLLQKSLLMQDLCVIAEDNESMSERVLSMSEVNERLPQQNDSMTEHFTAIVQDYGSMSEGTSSVVAAFEGKASVCTTHEQTNNCL